MSQPAGAPHTVAQVAALLGISQSAVYAAIASGRLRHLRFGRSVRIEPEAVSEWRIAASAEAQRRILGGETTIKRRGIAPAPEGRPIRVSNHAAGNERREAPVDQRLREITPGRRRQSDRPKGK
jgi:excisionase family DNA binding protein